MQINADLHSPGKFILNQFTNLILLILHIKSNLRKKNHCPPGEGGGGENIIIPGGKISGSAHDTHVVLKYIYYLKYMYI